MAQGGDEWELSKENVQPLKQGRVMSTLQEVLTQEESASHLAMQQQKKAFELEIRFYSGEDPLDVWDRYIRWTEQTFPQGGKESNLSLLLERAVKVFHQEKRYYGDPRYLNLWLKFKNFCSEPLDLYSYLHSQGIGTSLASLYITWAEEYEARGNNKKADAIFQEGLRCKAEPLNKLQCHHRQFQARVAQQVLQGISEGGDIDEDAGFLGASELQRVSLADLKGKGRKKRAPVNRVTDVVKPLSTQLPLPQQIPGSSRVKVFDENAVTTPGAELQSLTPQPWAVPPPARAKENEQRAGTWNSGQRPQSSHAQEVHSNLPTFTPYVEESTQPAVTPCKINPTINGVLSARKPGKEEDPFQRVQSQPEEKEQKVMYCKDKVCAGVEEFSFEEIRAEIYLKKVWKKREVERQAREQRRVELEQKIQEMERLLKEVENEEEQNLAEQPAHLSKPHAVVSSPNTPMFPEEQSELAVFTHSALDPLKFPPYHINLSASSERELKLQLTQQDQDQLCSVDLDLCVSRLSGPVPPTFTIFDESLPENQHTRLPVPSARCPLAPVSKHQESVTPKEGVMPQVLDDLAGIEPLNEEVIVTEHSDKTLFPIPEDTCDFMRAAHVVSTPFHGITAQRDESEPDSDKTIKENEKQPLSERTPNCEESSFNQALGVKKLSPILEVSQEDTRSSVSSSASSVSNTLVDHVQIPGELVSALSRASITNKTADETPMMCCGQLHRQLLEPLQNLFISSTNFYQEAELMPRLQEQEDVKLGSESYYIKQEVVLAEDNKIYLGASVDTATQAMVAIKVDSQPVSWDFYINLQLKERLGVDYQDEFENCRCFLYQDGCIMLYEELSSISIGNVIQACDPNNYNVVIVLAYHLLRLVEKLHTAEIVLGNLHPETLFLGNGTGDVLACNENTRILKLVDFTHSVDMRLQPSSSLNGFPLIETQYAQQILSEHSSPYQVDLLGIAEIVHLLLLGEHLQVHQEDFKWKLSQTFPKYLDSELWARFFERILNTDGKSTVCVLKELAEEMKPSSSSYQDLHNLFSLWGFQVSTHKT